MKDIALVVIATGLLMVAINVRQQKDRIIKLEVDTEVTKAMRKCVWEHPGTMACVPKAEMDGWVGQAAGGQ